MDILQALNKAFLSYFQRIILQVPQVLLGLTLLLLILIMGSLVTRLVKKWVQAKTEDPLLSSFVGRLLKVLFWTLGLVALLDQVGLGAVAGSMMAGAGVSAIIIGFAFKDIGENFLAGFFLAFSRPFSIGDVVESEGIKGRVKAMFFRSTHIRTFDGQDVYVPNAIIFKNPLRNFTRDGLLRHDFTIGIDYGDDSARAISAMMQALQGITEIEHADGLRPFVAIESFSTSSVVLRVYFWTNQKGFEADNAEVRNIVKQTLVRTLIDEQFTLPADIVELKIYQEGNPIPVTLIGEK